MKKITNKEENFSQWYQDLIFKANLAEHGQVRGTMVIKPRAYSIWEKIQDILNYRFKKNECQNAYFPALIPNALLEKEKEHIQGFSPELAVITHAGGNKLEEAVILRPTSETIIWNTCKNWISSYRDLPLKLNQWCNVFRWEMRTRLFLRTSEFLWQEGHCAFETDQEAKQDALNMITLYKEIVENYLCIPVIYGKKTELERFAGAEETYTIEALMQDNKALQSGTSHYLADNFARSFEVTFKDRDEKIKYIHSSSWGVSTRLIGGIIMSHSDNDGLVLPPVLADKKIVIVPIFKEIDKTEVLNYCLLLREEIASNLKKYFNLYNELEYFMIKDFSLNSIILDDDDSKRPGWKFAQWELFGIPLRIEIGSRDIKNEVITLARRDNKEKITVKKDQILETIKNLLFDMQKNIFEKAKKHRDNNIIYIEDYDSFKKHFNTKNPAMALVPYFQDKEIELKIKKELSISARVIPFDDNYLNKDKINSKYDFKDKNCIFSNKKANCNIIFSKSY